MQMAQYNVLIQAPNLAKHGVLFRELVRLVQRDKELAVVVLRPRVGGANQAPSGKPQALVDFVLLGKRG